MTALAEAYYRRLYAFHDDSPVIPLEEFYNSNHDPKDGKFTRAPGGKISTGGTGGKVWTGMSANPDNRVLPKSKVKFPLEPEAYETKGEARANFASRIYDADLGDGYQARVTNVQQLYGGGGAGQGVAVFIKIRKGHEEVGEASRELTTTEDGRLIAHHETLYIAAKHQGLGIADRFNAHAVAEYQRLGVDHIDLHAGATVGGYAWARQGYRIFEGDRKKFLTTQLDRLETQLKIPALRPHAKRLRADAAVLRKAIEAGEDVQPIHLASLGEKYARHTARDDHRNEYPTWPGKSLLIGTTWLGQYYFDANRAVTAAATDLEHAALRPAFRTEGTEEFYNRHHDKAGRFAYGAGYKAITAAQARGDSRPVSHDEFQRLATIGQAQLDRFADKASPITRLDRNWDQIKREAYEEVKKSWGGATIDSHTGEALAQGANAYAITVKGKGGKTVSVHENATEAEFNAAMDTARARFGSILARQSHYLGVFHDNDNGRIDIDPVLVVRSSRDVETIGAASWSVGGAYSFKDGLGYFAPHVDTSPAATNKRDDYVRTYDSPEVP